MYLFFTCIKYNKKSNIVKYNTLKKIYFNIFIYLCDGKYIFFPQCSHQLHIGVC